MFVKLARFMCVMVTFSSCAAHAERLSWPQGKHAAIVARAWQILSQPEQTRSKRYLQAHQGVQSCRCR